jgi:hypothetical protein
MRDLQENKCKFITVEYWHALDPPQPPALVDRIYDWFVLDTPASALYDFAADSFSKLAAFRLVAAVADAPFVLPCDGTPIARIESQRILFQLRPIE